MRTEFDVDYIDVRLAAGQPPPVFYDRCRWCNHEWHGFACASCDYCWSAVGARDDSWRPRLPRNGFLAMLEMMCDTGCDGWVAAAALTPAGSVRSLRLVQQLYGRAS